jgi:chaperone modulatory protein CbpM
MMRLQAVALLFRDLDREELAGWVARRWVRPEPAGDDFLFADVDVARVRLIHDLRRAMDVPEDTVPLVLSLLDQIYELRAALAAVRSGAR